MDAPVNATVPASDTTAAQPTPAAPAAPANDTFGFNSLTPEPTAADNNVASQAEPNPAPAPDVPEKYEFNLPEGLKMTPELETQFTAIAKEAKLSQAQADSLIKMHSDIVLGIQQEAEATKAKWAEECKQAGLSTPENLAAAKLAIDTFGGGEVMQTLVESGLAFNPGIQKMLQTIGHLLQEDNAPDGKPATQGKSAADLLFANSTYQ